jgi:5'-nucleotidase
MSLILVTNDDGIHSPGLIALYEAMKTVGEPVIIAPDRDNSAVSHSLTMNRPLRVKKISDDFFSVDGTPTDCVILGVEKLLGEKPALLVSGINPGGNLCEDISYSGTVSAAIEGTMLGINSLSFSMPGEEPFFFESAASVAKDFAQKVLRKGLPEDTLLNINIPNLPSVQDLPVRYTRQGKRTYADVVKETDDPWGRKHYWIGGGTPTWDHKEDTDSKQVYDGNISVTPIHLDLTNYEALKYFTKQQAQNDPR